MNQNDRLTQVFLDVQSGLPRQGPGTDASTRQALALCEGLPESPDVLDIGCGPGMQTLELARSLEGSITATDVTQEYLDQLSASVDRAGLEDRITVRTADMTEMPFTQGSFDLIWCEGAAYVLGFGAAFEQWRPMLRSGGYLAVTELTWLTAEPPTDAAEFFGIEYPPMTDIATNLATIERAGYDVIGHFTLPGTAWWQHYYTPLEAKLPAIRAKYAGDAEALAIVEMTTREIDMRRRFGDSYGYEFFVARATE